MCLVQVGDQSPYVNAAQAAAASAVPPLRAVLPRAVFALLCDKVAAGILPRFLDLVLPPPPPPPPSY